MKLSCFKKKRHRMLVRMQSKGSTHCWWECRCVRSLWKSVWWFLKKLGIDLSQDLVYHFWAYTPKISLTCSTIFIYALFEIIRSWKQPRYMSVDEWVEKIFIYIMEYYSVFKNEIVKFTGKWMELEKLILSEVT